MGNENNYPEFSELNKADEQLPDKITDQLPYPLPIPLEALVSSEGLRSHYAGTIYLESGNTWELKRSLPIDEATLNSMKIVNITRSHGAIIMHAFSDHPILRGSGFVLRLYIPGNDQFSNRSTVLLRQQRIRRTLFWNSDFDGDNFAFIGLARIAMVRMLNLDRVPMDGRLDVDQFMVNPPENLPDSEAEYVLLTQMLPPNQELGRILDKSNDTTERKKIIRKVNKRIIELHNRLLTDQTEEGRLRHPPEPTEPPVDWGSSEQIRQKLENNLSHMDSVIQWEAKYQAFQHAGINITDILTRFSNVMTSQFTERGLLTHLFEMRKEYIRHCHGGLHGGNR